LGNTLDATPDEGDWGNVAVQQSTFADIRAAGFNSVRIPGMLRNRCFENSLFDNL
jgi:endoglucanase